MRGVPPPHPSQIRMCRFPASGSCMGEPRSWWWNDGRPGVQAEGSASKSAANRRQWSGCRARAETAISARPSRLVGRTSSVVERYPLCQSRHRGPASSRSDGRAGRGIGRCRLNRHQAVTAANARAQVEDAFRHRPAKHAITPQLRGCVPLHWCRSAAQPRTRQGKRAKSPSSVRQ
jgi:hypothetical protein